MFSSGAGLKCARAGFFKLIRKMENCFETLVGLLNKETCNCSNNLPDGTATAFAWYHETFFYNTEDNPVVFVADYKLPTIEGKLEVYENGVLISADRYTIEGNEISIEDPVQGGYYQIWYYAEIENSEAAPAFDTSKSGLFVSDLLPESEVQGLAGSWQRVAEKRTFAIKELIASLHVAARRTTVEKHARFSGAVGTDQTDGYLQSSKAYAGIQIRTNPIKSGTFRINRIASYFEKQGTISAWIFDRSGTVVTPKLSIKTAGGGKKSITDVGITLPMLQDFGNCQDYFILFEYDPTNRPKLNKTYCAPCNKNSVNPITYVNRYGYVNEWPTDYRGSLAWNNYLIVGGVEVDDVSDFSGMTENVSTFMNGISLDIEAGCDMAKGFCRMINGGGPEVQALAMAIQRRTASLVVSEKGISSTPSRSTIAKGDRQSKEADKWEADFAEAMNYLAGAITEDSNDCVECKPKFRMGGIHT